MPGAHAQVRAASAAPLPATRRAAGTHKPWQAIVSEHTQIVHKGAAAQRSQRVHLAAAAVHSIRQQLLVGAHRRPHQVEIALVGCAEQ